MRRLCVFVALVGAPIWLPWAFPGSVGDFSAPPVAATVTASPGSVPVASTSEVPAPTSARPATTTSSPPPPGATRSFAASRVVPPPPPPMRPPRHDPALAADFPDPDVIRVGATWWAYATGTTFDNLQVRSSPDLVSWSQATDPLPGLPAWAVPGYSWAPAVTPSPDGFLLYYAARDVAFGRQCLSVAWSPGPAGPFVDTSSAPLTCQAGSGGSIDPAPFTAPDGTRYLVWKSEDNALGLASRIGVEELSADGRGLVGDRPRLLTATAPWQAGVVEGPAMVDAGGAYFLLYGANHWDTVSAGIGYAVCRTPTGPCVDQSRTRPWLGSFTGGYGPSGPDVFTGPDGRDWIAFHAWNRDPLGGGARPLARQLWIEPLTILDGVPVIG